DKIADTICWTIKKNYLYKNDIMNLDIIASNKWKRPIYFTTISSVHDYLDIDNYSVVEGWLNKFIPVKADPEDYLSGLGGVDPLNSYDIFMHKSAWGNLADPHVYIDPETRNNAFRPKTNILRTAQSLIHMGEKKKALDLMDLYFKRFPYQKFPVDMDDAIYANLYYRAGEIEKANGIVKLIAKVYNEDLDYYYSFTGDFATAYKDDIQNGLEMLHSLQMLAAQNKQDKLAKEMEAIFNRQVAKYKE
ncbi:MAG: hypothetical protein ABSD71_12785, partial [Bacteroidales bacterium]